MTFLEAFVALKFMEGSGNMIEAPTPVYIWLPWSAIVTFIVVYYIYLRFKKDATTLTTGNEYYLT